MSEDNKIIKNPKRNVEATERPPRPARHIPEWVKYGKEPNIFDVSNKDFVVEKGRKQRGRNSSIVHQAPYPEHAPVQPPITNKINAGRRPLQPQTKLSVGANSNWFEQQDSDGNEPIMYDEIPNPPDDGIEVEDSSDYKEERSELEPNEYGIFIKGVLVAWAFTSKEVEALMEKFIFDTNNEISVEDLIVLKRVEIKVGVLTVE